MPRLFTAIELATDVKAVIAQQQHDLAAALRRRGNPVRTTPAEQLHLTLVFIGQVADDRAAAIADAMRRPLSIEPFTIGFGGVGVFPPRGRARVLWLGVSRGADATIALFEDVSARLADVGVPRETRPFRPHLTIGRWRDGEGPQRLEAPQATLDAVQEVAAVTLFESRLHPAGATHVPLVSSPLGGPPLDPVH
jgi:2'-5' RNA ligase